MTITFCVHFISLKWVRGSKFSDKIFILNMEYYDSFAFRLSAEQSIP